MSLRHTLYEGYKNLHNRLHSVRTVSDFQKSGKLTPREFVDAGDELISKVPVWQWVGGPADVQEYLPLQKKCLVYRGAPCTQRAPVDDVSTSGTFKEVECSDEDGFVLTEAPPTTEKPVCRIDDTEETILTWDDDDDDDTDTDDNKPVNGPAPRAHHDTEAPPAGCHAKSNLTAGAVNTGSEGHSSNMPKTAIGNNFDCSSDDEDVVRVVQLSDSQRRLYDVYIVYDRYHMTPRLYLIGYANDQITPLTVAQMKQDVYHSNYGKTVTIDAHPILGVSCISIHPCRHAETMQRMIERMKVKHEQAEATSGRGKGQAEPFTFPTHMALFLFLKFISSAVPTIQYDVSSGFEV